MQRDSLSPPLFVASLILLSMVLMQMKIRYDLGNRRGLINHLLLNMNDLKFYRKVEKQIDTLATTVRIFRKDIEMEFGIIKMCCASNETGKACECEGIVLPDAQVIRGLK